MGLDRETTPSRGESGGGETSIAEHVFIRILHVWRRQAGMGLRGMPPKTRRIAPQRLRELALSPGIIAVNYTDRRLATETGLGREDSNLRMAARKKASKSAVNSPLSHNIRGPETFRLGSCQRFRHAEVRIQRSLNRRVPAQVYSVRQGDIIFKVTVALSSRLVARTPGERECQKMVRYRQDEIGRGAV
jgi:hypothetical protein